MPVASAIVNGIPQRSNVPYRAAPRQAICKQLVKTKGGTSAYPSLFPYTTHNEHRKHAPVGHGSRGYDNLHCRHAGYRYSTLWGCLLGIGEKGHVMEMIIPNLVLGFSICINCPLREE